MKYILSHDLGTSGNKASLFTTDGELAGSETCRYNTYYGKDKQVEQDPLDWWNAFCLSTRKLMKGINPADVAVISFSGQMMGCLCVDRRGMPLRRSIIYSDQRAEHQTNRLKSLIDEDEFYHITGTRINPSYSIEKLMWIADNEPEIYKHTYKSLQAKEFLVLRLTGRFVTEYNDAGGTSAFNIIKKEWSPEILSLAGISDDKFPEAVPSISVVGETNGRFLEEAGLPAGIPVVIGAGDGGAATVGAGSVKPLSAYNYIGSSSWISITTEEPFFDKERTIFNWVHPVPGYYQPCGSMQTAGSSYEWLKNQILLNQGPVEGEDIYSRMDSLIRKSKPMANGTVFMPYLMGERTPWWDPDVKGAFLGLNLNTGIEDLVRSVVEGICFNLDMIKEIYHSSYSFGEMNVFGGMAGSDVFLQMLSDITGLNLNVLNHKEEATSMGAAVIGGVGAGIFSDFSIVNDFISVNKTIKPEPAALKEYRNRGNLLGAAYQSLAGFNKLIGSN